jgi:tetratricopeptide (TPR) repeat protein
MSVGDPSAGETGANQGGGTTARKRDLAGQAIAAAEQALAEGEQALVKAQAELLQEEQGVRRSRRREIALRVLLAANLLAMIAVAAWPAPAPRSVVPNETEVRTPATGTGSPSTSPSTSASNGTTFTEPYNRALAAAEKRDFAQAVSILDKYLADSPRMLPSQQLSVLMALAHYAARNNDFKKAQEYQRRADAIDDSHCLPEDLVTMAKAAAESGDQESLRRVWARFLLQQRQIPSWLYKHVAEAYLQLGDSYRQQANAAQEQARLKELEDTATRLREQAKSQTERGK